ncbi:A disintegrin and metalloproteinase with thrombospondin motifs 13 isoform X2 [Boleophthalmus pectinirostris]|uniref:A disintegrin and metalloproteinase with thrombospondin motifs 13 isoform X2 n=1 Tax=Boleophthalmus pectinirostris TaxID=150288 RepID=UPI00242EFB0E|nr:A disintegrin and metalloproteinase with thrombospondin motifs 13 isoform X2 [Boleophthalmus pectinirostris]
MFFVLLVCLLLLRPGSTAIMTSPLYKSVQWDIAKNSSVSPSWGSAQIRQYRSVNMPDVTHLELLVVVGPDVHNVHQQDTERYILTNLNIASELLRDITLGANMRMHLVRLIILTEPEPEIEMSPNITSSLRSVCDWGKRIHPPNDTNPLHADLLLYITRYDLVLPDGNKQVRGVTQLGGVCSEDWSCVITEDTGFDLGITIAHEIGHSFGINHDGVENSCSSSGFMMASDGGHNSVDLTWSSCSRQQLLTFFSKGKADCVKDLPVLGGSLHDWRPGLFYGVNEQCRIAFGKTARACTFKSPDLPPCRVLSCHIDNDSSCKRLFVPLLDGTECGLNQWCLKGRCVSPDELDSSVVVHGSWSGWSDFSPCSRTCGGGVTHRTRKCDNPKPAFGGHHCVGQEIQAELCHQNPCEHTQLDFMAEQCSLTDHHPLYLYQNIASFYTWTPAIGVAKGNDQCRHMCQSERENFIVSRGSQFVDGTRCEFDSPPPFGSTAACLKGNCQLFGCDGVLLSEKINDNCGVCGGDGSSCTLTSDSFTGGLAKKYITFLAIPMNATQVHIVNSAPLFTHMAVLVGGQYIVSGKGNMALNLTHPSPLDENHVEYRLHLTPDLLPEMEELLLPGPVQQEIHIQVYRKYGKEYGEKTNPNITYKFYLQTHNRSSLTSQPKGKWSQFITPCSVSCGSGVQKHLYLCVDQDTREQLKPKYCNRSMPSDPLYTTCQQPQCPPRWEIGEFGPCSSLCGGGERLRPVRCVQEHGNELMSLPVIECRNDTAPPAVEKCNMHHCPTRWHVSELGKCSAVCGPGEAKRDVFCVWEEGGRDIKVNDSLCIQLNRPHDIVPCVVNVCPVGWESKAEDQPRLKFGLMPRSRPASVYVWSPVSSQCSKTCGNGTLQVWFSCLDHQTRLGVPDFHCDASTRPQPYSEICSTSSCPPIWRSKQGVCSVTCGGGVANLVQYCAVEKERGEVVADDTECQDFPKPKAVVACNTHSCPARWKVLQTLACSVSCGLGVAQRTVLCVQFFNGNESVVPDNTCHAAVKPASTVPCLMRVCSFRWEIKPWTQCSVTCGYGIQSRAVSCVGPTNPEPVSPLLCMHMPKPLTIQGCNVGCLDKPPAPVVNPTTISTALTLSIPANHTEGPLPPPTVNLKESPHHRIDHIRTTEAIYPLIIPTAQAPTSSICGSLLLDESGKIDLTNATSRCMVSIGRPLDEIIHIEVESSSLDCSKREYVAFFDRMSFVRRCKQIAGSALTTRTNVLLVRQNLLTEGNGVILKYKSQKNMKKNHHKVCDIQLFAPIGIFENPTTLDSNQTCRVLINAPPSVKIRIQAKYIGLVFSSTNSQSSYIMIRDMDVLKTHVFSGQRLFVWQSSGNMAEVEFHGDYLRSRGIFRAEYSFISS